MVVSAAARAIARRKDNNTLELLSGLAKMHPLNGLIAALATFRQPSTISVLIDALSEDEVRQTAEVALASFGPEAHPVLLNAIARFKFTNPPQNPNFGSAGACCSCSEKLGSTQRISNNCVRS